jgi:2-polyprenyl-3-methyl-5-hydroxy-6-metoxy-1,4-benzoquinol methylase
VSCTVCRSTRLVEYRPPEIHRVEEVSFSYSFSPEHNKTFRVVRCRSCSHLFCHPLPEGIVGSYQQVVDEEYLKHSESRRLAAQAVLRTVRRHAPSGRLLDIGCATGDFLVAGREAGYAVEGIELSGWSCAIARSRGLRVHQETLEQFAKRSPGYDVVSLIGVIEHFTEPRREMENIARIARPGAIVVIWTGDASSLLARVLGRHWWYWQGQHVQYFTHESLRRLVQSSGFEHVQTERYPFAATHATLSNSLRRYRFHKVLSAAIRPVFRVRPVVYLRLPGEMLLLAKRL